MLPSKGYFSTLECPFYLSASNCIRPYCHFKHPKRDIRVDKNEAVAEKDTEEEEKRTSVAPVPPKPAKHIPIASIPTKPQAISVNTKKSKTTLPYVPTLVRNEAGYFSAKTVAYEPTPIMETGEKTYSRYSYEKGHDSGDEIMENHKSIIETNHVSKSDDGIKNEDDQEEIEPEFSPTVSPKSDQLSPTYESDIEVKFQVTPPLQAPPPVISQVPEEKTTVKNKCKKKRKYDEMNSSEIKLKTSEPSPVKDKTDRVNHNDNKVQPVLSKRLKVEEDVDKNLIKSSEKKPCKLKEKTKHSSSHPDKKHSSDNKKPSDKKHSSSNSKEGSDKLSDHKKKVSSDSKKHSTESKKHTVSKQSSSDSKTRPESADSKKSLSRSHSSSEKTVKRAGDIKKHSSSSGSGKKHSKEKDGKQLFDGKKSSDKKKSVSDKKHSSESKKVSSESGKKKVDSKHGSSKSKSHSSSHKKQGDSKSGKEERREERRHKEGKSNSTSKERDRKKTKVSNREGSKKRKDSESSGSVSERKETILISDSEESEASEVEVQSSPDVADLLGLGDSSGEDEYTPLSLSENTNLPYRPTPLRTSSDDDLDSNFKLAPRTNEESHRPPTTSSKIRIAHVPNVSSLISAKNLINSSKTVSPAMQKIVASSVTLERASTPRVTPVNSNRPKPQISFNLESVVALSIRQPGLNNIYDELIKFVDYEEAFKRAIEEETEICSVATNPQSYRNRIALCILRIRKSKGQVDVVKKERITSSSVPDYTYGVTLYECFSKYLLQPEDYILHGYPLELPGKRGCVYIDKSSHYRNKKTGPTEGPFRKCVNCGQEYAVDEDTGMPLSKDDCHHHWGKPIGQRQGKIYTCCKSEVGSEPCHTSVYHVTETKSDDCLQGFVRLPPYPSEADPNRAGIYAMDCEMCFTTRGRDIVRASLLAVDNESVYDVLIKPKDPVLDYCTRFSGITEEKLAPITTTLEDVQRFLMKTLNDKTILVGHSLENDLKALKLIHFNVVDTSVMFPHKEGLPVKCALRTLCSRLLGQAIQTGEHGHDSLEDARGCLQLVLHQVKEDAKSRKPRVVKQLK